MSSPRGIPRPQTRITYPFVPIPIEALDAGLDVYAQAAYIHLTRRSMRHGEAWESLQGMADACGMSKRRLQQALDTLADRGMIDRAGRTGRTNVITLTAPEEWAQQMHAETPADEQTVAPDAMGVARGAMGVAPGATEVEELKEMEPKKKKHTRSKTRTRRQQEPRSPTGDARADAALQDQPVTPGHLVEAWNELRRSLPAAEAAPPGSQRARALQRLIKRHGERSLRIWRAAAQQVASDPFWQQRGYGIDNLLAGEKYLGKAEAWTQNQHVGGADHRPAASRVANLIAYLEGQDAKRADD